MQKVAILYDASQAVLSAVDQDEVLEQILAILRDYFHVNNVTILLLNEQKTELVPKAQIGWGSGKLDIKISLEDGITGAAVRQKRPVYVREVANDSRYIATCKTTRSELAVPLMVRDSVIGVLDCQSDQADFFDEETIDLLTLFFDSGLHGTAECQIALSGAAARQATRGD